MTFTVNGELVFSTVLEWRRKGCLFISETPAPEFDFAQVELSDSSGVALLLAWLREANAAGKPVSFRNLPQQLLDVAKVCGVLSLIQTNESHING